MRIIAFSDIHGNYENLLEIMDNIKNELPDQIIFLGDILTKGNDGIKCLDYLMNNHILCVLGNAELYVNKGIDIDTDAAKYKDYYDKLNEILTEEQKEFIANMPLMYRINFKGKNLLFEHFIINNKDDYYPYHMLATIRENRFKDIIKDLNYDLVVVGHYHKSFVCDNVISIDAACDGINYTIIDIDDEINYKFINKSCNN